MHSLNQTSPILQQSAAIVRAEICVVSIPLIRPIRWEGGEEAETGFVLLRLVDADGVEGLAEVAAKPTWNGFDTETMVLALDRLALPLCRGLRTGDLSAPTGRLVENTAPRALIDNALWDLAQSRDPVLPAPVPVSWTLTRAAPSEMAAEAVRMADLHGFRTFKIKGGQGLSTDLTAIELIAEELGPDARLYVDANGAVGWEDARAYVDALSETGIVALEDPYNLKPDSRLVGLQTGTDLPILVDFNCDGVSAAWAFLDRGARGLSIKPSRFGMAKSLAMTKLTEERKATRVMGLFGESAGGAIPLLALQERLGTDARTLPAEAAFHLSFRDHYLHTPPVLKDGRMTRPETGSLANSIDWARFDRLGGQRRIAHDFEG